MGYLSESAAIVAYIKQSLTILESIVKKIRQNLPTLETHAGFSSNYHPFLRTAPMQLKGSSGTLRAVP
jgi:hypothetical protein